MLIQTQKEQSKENFHYMSKKTDWAIDNSNNSFGRLSSELATLAGILIGFITIASSELRPTKPTEIIQVCIFGYLFICSIFFSIVHRIFVNKFWKKEAKLSDKNTTNWRKACEDITSMIENKKLETKSREQNVSEIFSNACNKETEINQDRNFSSSDTFLYFQTFFLSIGFITAFHYFITKVISLSFNIS